jgi:hypothetical protein
MNISQQGQNQQDIRELSEQEVYNYFYPRPTPNPTVVTEKGWPNGACSGSDERRLGEYGERTTRPIGRGRGVGERARGHRRGVALRTGSMGPGRASQPPLSLEVREALGRSMRWGGFPRFFF